MPLLHFQRFARHYCRLFHMLFIAGIDIACHAAVISPRRLRLRRRHAFRAAIFHFQLSLKAAGILHFMQYFRCRRHYERFLPHD